jgi:hypothetical protein
LTSLNFASNNLGELVLPDGWSIKDEYMSYQMYREQKSGREQKGRPGKPEGVIALANAIPDMGALTSLDISNNKIGAYYDYSKWVSTPEGSCLSSNNATSYMPLVYG